MSTEATPESNNGAPEGGLDRRMSGRIGQRSSIFHREFVFGDAKPEFTKDQLTDISVDGFAFIASTMCAVGDMLEVRLELHGWDKHRTEFYTGDPTRAVEPLVALAKVVSVVSGELGPKVGCLFESIDEWHRIALGRYVDMAAQRQL